MPLASWPTKLPELLRKWQGHRLIESAEQQLEYFVPYLDNSRLGNKYNFASGFREFRIFGVVVGLRRPMLESRWFESGRRLAHSI